MKNYDPATIKQIENLLNIGIALSAEREHNRVLEMILGEARQITRADAGTLYLCEDDQLVFKFIQNDTMKVYQGGSGEEIDLPPLPITRDSVTGYTALTRTVVNIDDVYNTDQFNFSGPKRYDKITGYRTTSMLVAPMEDHQGKIIGVLQLINAQDDDKQVIPFAPYYEKVIASLASQAAVSVNNIRILREVEELLRGVVESMATAIDARTPYNASHTLRIARMAKGLIEAINQLEKGPFADEYFDQDRKEQLIMSAWLHDIGKVAIPLSVMDKATRLGGGLDLILQRLDYIETYFRYQQYKGNYIKDKGNSLSLNELIDKSEEARELIRYADQGDNFIDEEIKERLGAIAELTYPTKDGDQKNWLSQEELTALCISKGTLTAGEREKIEGHVKIATRILQAIPFPDRLNRIPEFVSMHHEYLDGTGYPQGLKGDELPLEARILTIADIFDALVAADRPYKRAKPVEVALKILNSMVEEGKLDGDLLAVFQDFKVWEGMKDMAEDYYQLW